MPSFSSIQKLGGVIIRIMGGKARGVKDKGTGKNGSSLRLTLVVGCQSYSLIWPDHPASRLVFAVLYIFARRSFKKHKEFTVSPL